MRLTDLLGDNGSRLHAAAQAAVEQLGAEPSDVELLAPVPVPASIRDFMAFEEHMVTGSAAIGLTFDPLCYDLPGSTSPTRLRFGARTPTSRSRPAAPRSTTSLRWPPSSGGRTRT